MPDLTGIREYTYIEPVLSDFAKDRTSKGGLSAESEDGVTYGKDEVELSPEARQYQEKLAAQADGDASAQDPEQAAEVKRVSAEMARREQEVLSHEMAHMAAGGGMTGAVSYEYEMGPDGKRYIVGGEVPIHYSTGGDPKEVIQKMEQVRKAALSPANPSPQDRAVAAQAAQIEARAREELAQQAAQKTSDGAGTGTESAAEAGLGKGRLLKGLNVSA